MDENETDEVDSKRRSREEKPEELSQVTQFLFAISELPGTLAGSPGLNTTEETQRGQLTAAAVSPCPPELFLQFQACPTLCPGKP